MNCFLSGITGLIIFALLGIIIHFCIYKRVFKGSNRFPRRKVILGSLLAVYLAMVFGVTILNRGIYYQSYANIHFLRSYKEAWNIFSINSWQFIILNIIMFIPLGFILPLFHKRFRKVYINFGAGFILTLFIELVQLSAGLGIFDIDDIFNNSLGTLIGYGIIMALLTIIKSEKRRWLKAAGFLSPLLITSAVFVGIFAYYNYKEFGNLPYEHIYRINLEEADIKLNVSLKENKDTVPVYKAPKYTKEQSIKWAKDFFNNLGIDESEIEIDAYNDSVLFSAKAEHEYSIWFDYVGGSYRFTDFSHFDEELEPIFAEEDLVIAALSDFGVTIPKKAQFSNKDEGEYQWEANSIVEYDTLFDGYITCTYYSDNSIKELNNTMIEYNKFKDVSIKSEKKAFEELTEGKFRYYDDENISEIIVEGIELEYVTDTKGFYQPVYSFKTLINGNESYVIIPAME